MIKNYTLRCLRRGSLLLLSALGLGSFFVSCRDKGDGVVASERLVLDSISFSEHRCIVRDSAGDSVTIDFVLSYRFPTNDSLLLHTLQEHVLFSAEDELSHIAPKLAAKRYFDDVVKTLWTSYPTEDYPSPLGYSEEFYWHRSSDLTYDGATLSSFVISQVNYLAGGAHVYVSSTPLSIEKKTGKLLRVLDLIKEESEGDFARLVLDKIKDSLSTDGVGSMDMIDKELVPQKIEDNSITFQLSDKGMLVYFAPYEISSYNTLGEIAIPISYSELQTMLKEVPALKPFLAKL